VDQTVIIKKLLVQYPHILKLPYKQRLLKYQYGQKIANISSTLITKKKFTLMVELMV